MKDSIKIDTLLNELPSKPNHFKNEPDNIGLHTCLHHRNYIEESILYVKYFGKVPNRLNYLYGEFEKVLNSVINIYKAEIQDSYIDRTFSFNGYTTEVILVLWDSVILRISENCTTICFRDTDPEKLNKLSSLIQKLCKKTDSERFINIIYKDTDRLNFNSLGIKRNKLNINSNYNDDFKEIHRIILKRLRKENDKGIILLHGKPGTGKTYYIRYLISVLKKKVIFLPPNLAGYLTNPELITLLTDSPNTIFVIEDAEDIVIDRGQDSNSAMSTLLNLSDGLLSECLNIQIICSFNVDISKVDSALLRKGRLIAKYEFKELKREKAQALSNKLGFKTVINQDMSLSDIYNQDEKNFLTEKSSNIGFKF